MVPNSDELETLPLSESQPEPEPEPEPQPQPEPGSETTYHSFIDPPSYNDAVFSLSSSPTSPQRRRRPHLYLSISVSDPRPEPGPTSSSSFITYLITSSTPSSSRFHVRRRFRDFVTLSDRLAESHRGLFIPPRPDKNTVESQVVPKSEFVEQRRVQLEKYLRRLAAHPVIGRSEELRLFLTAEGKLPLAATTDVASRVLDGAVRLPRQLVMGEGAVVGREEVVREAKGGMDLLRIFKELKQSAANEWGGGRRVVGVVVEEDKEFMERKEKVQDWEHLITGASVQVLRSNELSNV